MEQFNVDVEVELGAEIEVDEADDADVEVKADLGVDIESNAFLVHGDPVGAVSLLAVVATITAAFVLVVAGSAAGLEGVDGVGHGS